ncbi:kinase-like domain-containing protein, partial [Thelephora terrestris]
FCKEAVIWRHLHHPNIVPLIGVAISPGQCLLVSDWVDNGTIDQFIKMNPNVKCTNLLIDVVKGLMYMHNLSIVHGGLCTEKILITRSGHACLTGFGNATTARSLQGLRYQDKIRVSNFSRHGGQFWMVRRCDELYATGLTKELDVYALGLVIDEVRTFTYM